MAKTTSLLSSLKLVAVAKGASTTDPVVLRRTAMMTKLQEQLKLHADPNWKRIIKKRGGKDDKGKTIWLSEEQKVTKWWTENADGSLVFSIFFQFKPLEIQKGLAGIPVQSFDKLPETINLLIGAVKAGELDAQLKAASDASPMKGKSKPKKK